MKRLIVFLLAMAIAGWVQIGSMPTPDWTKLQINEKKAVVNILTDNYFNTFPWCEGAEIQIREGTAEVLFFAKCTKKGC